MSRPSLRAAINAMCRRCIHDPHTRGNWREQVAQLFRGRLPSALLTADFSRKD